MVGKYKNPGFLCSWNLNEILIKHIFGRIPFFRFPRLDSLVQLFSLAHYLVGCANISKEEPLKKDQLGSSHFCNRLDEKPLMFYSIHIQMVAWNFTFFYSFQARLFLKLYSILSLSTEKRIFYFLRISLLRTLAFFTFNSFLLGIFGWESWDFNTTMT